MSKKSKIFKNLGNSKNFQSNKKSQAAMEFLMTYGWAIIVVLVAIGALTYFGVLSPDKFAPSKCYCRFTSMEDTSRYITVEDIDYVECMNITTKIDYENKEIVFDEIKVLYMCINNSLIRM